MTDKKTKKVEIVEPAKDAAAADKKEEVAEVKEPTDKYYGK